MRACATANAVFVGLAAAALGFAACSSGGSTPSTPNAPDAPTSSDTAKPPATGSPDAPANVGPAPSGPPKSMITNEPPDGGVVLNNAMTSADAGSSDRFQSMVDVIKANRDGFRRCFDLWSAKNPGAADGKIVMIWNLKPDGALDSADVDVSKSTVSAPDVTACMVAHAKSLTYPKSPVGKQTRFTYPFDFKRH